MFFEIIVRPIWNLLVWLTDISPLEMNLAFGIIALTILTRLILLAPSAKAIRSQREMQKIQPELEAIKKKFAGDQKRIGEETMKLFREHEVNPFGGCLPILIQLPIIYGIFEALRLGITTVDGATLYSFLQMPEAIELSFFWVADLQTPDAIVLPLLVGGLQFIQMWRMMGRKMSDLPPEQKMMQQMMVYGMPIFLVFIARSFPAALGLYWATTTLFSIAQQEVMMQK